MSTDPDRCSLRSLAAREPLAGTASVFRRWLLLEHPGPWGEDGIRDARLTEVLREELRDWQRRTRGRVLLIRPAGRGARSDAPSCVAVDTGLAWMGRRRIDRLDDLVGVDLVEADAFPDPVVPDPVGGPLFVVCTHGRRDVCCAERGRPLAESAAGAAPGRVWESTHVGGDRFAGNLVAFPHGLYFGRVEPERAGEIVRACADGRIVLDRYRGRASDPTPVQAADHAVRIELNLDAIDDVRPVEVSRAGETVSVTFATSRGEVDATVERALAERMRLTCHADRAERPTAWRVSSVAAKG